METSGYLRYATARRHVSLAGAAPASGRRQQPTPATATSTLPSEAAHTRPYVPGITRAPNTLAAAMTAPCMTLSPLIRP